MHKTQCTVALISLWSDSPRALPELAEAMAEQRILAILLVPFAVELLVGARCIGSGSGISRSGSKKRMMASHEPDEHPLG